MPLRRGAGKQAGGGEPCPMGLPKPRLSVSDVIGYLIGYAVLAGLVAACAYFFWSGVQGLRHGGLVVGGSRGSVAHFVTRAAHPIQYWFYELLELAMPLVVIVPVVSSLLQRRSRGSVFQDTGGPPVG